MTLSMEDSVHHGTPAFRRTNLAMFAAGVATFGLLYGVQPLMPEFSRQFHISAAQSAMPGARSPKASAPPGHVRPTRDFD